MNTHRLTSCLLAPLLALACEEPGDPDAPQPASPVAPAPDPAVATDPEADMAPLIESAATGFPPAFQGRWGLAEGDCAAAGDAAEGLMRVMAEEIGFYESNAGVEGIETSGLGRVRADLSFAGEGEAWQRSGEFRLRDLQTLVVAYEDLGNELVYTRCGSVPAAE